MRVRALWDGLSFRPLVTAWVGAGLIGAAATKGWITTQTALIDWTALIIILLLVANYLETREIHRLTNSAHTLLEQYVVILTDALKDANVDVPDDPAGKP
jgi:hypothetical protein